MAARYFGTGQRRDGCFAYANSSVTRQVCADRADGGLTPVYLLDQGDGCRSDQAFGGAEILLAQLAVFFESGDGLLAQSVDFRLLAFLVVLGAVAQSHLLIFELFALGQEIFPEAYIFGVTRQEMAGFSVVELQVLAKRCYR